MEANKPLRILIPIAPFQFLRKEVIDGISGIDIPYQIFIHHEDSNPHEDWKGVVARTREYLRRFAGFWYCLLLDSDVILEDWIVPFLIEYLDNHSEVGMAAISSRLIIKEEERKSHPHVNLSCALIRSDVLREVPFRFQIGDPCECVNFNNDVRSAGWEVHYACTDNINEVET